MCQVLASKPAYSHVACVHSETTSGIINDVESVGKVCAILRLVFVDSRECVALGPQIAKKHGKSFIVDAMSSFGAVPVGLFAAWFPLPFLSPSRSIFSCTLLLIAD